MKLRAKSGNPQMKVHEQFAFEVGIDHPALAGWASDAIGIVSVFARDVRLVLDRFDARYP